MLCSMEGRDGSWLGQQGVRVDTSPSLSLLRLHFFVAAASSSSIHLLISAMDSLLANYGSDDDADDQQQQQLPTEDHKHIEALVPPAHMSDRLDSLPSSSVENPLHTQRKRPLFSSLPPPIANPAPLSLLFQSLPPPKSLLRPTAAGTGSLSPPSLPASENQGVPAGKRRGFSLFDSLPPPQRPAGATASKRLVEFKPPVNRALLEAPDDDEPSAKRLASEKEGRRGKAGSGLTAILPPPKNLGAVTGNRHAMLELASDTLRGEDAEVSGGGTSRAVSRVASSSYGAGEVDLAEIVEQSEGQDYQDWSMTSMAAQAGGIDSGQFYHGYDHSDSSAQTNPACNAPEVQYYHHPQAFIPGTEGYSSAQHLPSQGITDSSSYHQQNWVRPTDQKSEDPFANIMRLEKRRGKEEPPPNFIEVKQADLTHTRLREDQLRVTGIAFGPTYQPVSSDKDKPSKLHKRKHQIGSLYFDMKQKEMELLERRAKGQMTKTQTQAKYGW